MAQIHTTISSNSYAILDGLLPDESDSDFDRGEMAVLFRGTEAQLRAAFPKGNSGNYPGAGSVMICAGVRVTKSRFGFLWATVLWIGLITPPSSVLVNGTTLQMLGSTIDLKAVTNNASTVELSLPQGAIVAGVPFTSANAAFQRPRQRIINPAWSRDYAGIMVIARNAPPVQPKLLGGTRPAGLPTKFNSAPATDTAAIDVSQTNWFDGINVADQGGGGWCLRNFQSGSVLILGNWLLLKWTAGFEWIDRHGI